MQLIKQILNNQPFETIAILKELNLANRYLAELKGLCCSLPNQDILTDTLPLQEAQDSSAIENIITTQDQVFKYKLQPKHQNLAAKEVNNYAKALNYCYHQIGQNNLISVNTIIEAQQLIKGNNAGIRTQIGTTLIDETTKQVIYTPPPPNEIKSLLSDLETFINDADYSDLDPLIKMAIIHHQFESIHPFYDGNGRIGRIINSIYLVQQGLLDRPILYLSRYINHNKQGYYHLLQTVRDQTSWQEWVLFMLKAVHRTAKHSLVLINNIKQLQQDYKQIIRSNHYKIYSQNLLNNIFRYPYTKIQFLRQDLNVSRLTASRYLDALTKAGLLYKNKLGRENYYLNFKLIEILSDTESMKEPQ